LHAHISDRIGGGHRLAVREPSQPRSGVLRRLRQSLIVLVVSAVTLTWLIVLPLRWIDPTTTAFMLRDGSARDASSHEWSAWTEIGSAPPLAVIAAEDQNFTEHWGFDVGSIAESIVDYADGGSLRGASTISQQVAKNLYLWPGKSFLRKGLEAWLTVLLEATLSKRRILEIYLNVAEFGPGIYGIRAASGAYFDKEPSELTDAEAALLAAVLPNPKRLHANEPSAYVLERQDWIEKQMERIRGEPSFRSL
jgi:monofunctional biosynthetic peptidoglycan transglycosylase